jgi:hypothetical protein
MENTNSQKRNTLLMCQRYQLILKLIQKLPGRKISVNSENFDDLHYQVQIHQLI